MTHLMTKHIVHIFQIKYCKSTNIDNWDEKNTPGKYQKYAIRNCWIIFGKRNTPGKYQKYAIRNCWIIFGKRNKS